LRAIERVLLQGDSRLEFFLKKLTMNDNQTENMILSSRRRREKLAGMMDFRRFSALAGYEPHEGQKLIHASDRRFRLAVCGRRFGKSMLAANEAAFNALMPDARVWVVAPYRELAGRVWRHAREVLVHRMRLKPESDRASEMYLKFPWGAELIGKTAENPDSLLGEGLDFVVLDEAPRIREGVFARFILPSLTDRRGRALIIGTPRGRGWVWRLFSESQGDSAWEIFSLRSSVNPCLSADEIALHRRMLADCDFRREYLAEWVAEGSLVYPMFDPLRHIAEIGFKPELPLYLGVDFGFTNPGCALFAQVTPMDDVRVLGEVYKRGLTAPEWADAIREKLSEITGCDDARAGAGSAGNASVAGCSVSGRVPTSGSTTAIMTRYRSDRGCGSGTSLIDIGRPDNEFAGIAVAFCDPAGAGERAVLERHGIATIGPRAGVMDGIARVRALLAPGDENIPPRIKISPKCRKLIREFGSYSYDADGAENAVEGFNTDAGNVLPGHGSRAALLGGISDSSLGEAKVVKRDDHALDALRYLVVGLGM